MRTPILAVLALFAAGASSPGGCNGERPPYDACAGKACGAPCTACPPGATDCGETAVVKACDPSGRCVPAAPDLCGEGEPHPDCVGKACGDSCNPCGPERTCPTLVATGCDRFGRCATDLGWLCHDPCAGKACGEACRLCPPDAPDCAETMELKACDREGRCVSATPSLSCP